MVTTHSRRAIVVFGAAALAMMCGCDGPTAPALLVAPAFDVVDTGDLPIEISVKISPNALVLGVEGTWVTIHTNVPFTSADRTELLLNGVPAALAFADDRGYLVVKFAQGAIEAIVTPPEASLTLTGKFTNGTPFFGSDTILVREQKPQDPPKAGR
jgi:hypothetical protein